MFVDPKTYRHLQELLQVLPSTEHRTSLENLFQRLQPSHSHQQTITPVIPDYFEPLTAWRAWGVQGQGLVSWNHERWEPRKALEAQCRRFVEQDICQNCGFTGHTVPSMSCYCGIYCFKDMLEAIKQIGHTIGGGMALAFGQVSIWGRIVEHTQGYRAQYAYPKALFSNIRGLSQWYGVEVLPLQDLHTAIQQQTGMTTTAVSILLRDLDI